jgi:hypothetical protein
MRQILLLALTLSPAFGLACGDLAFAATVEVVTSRGQTLAGEVDARTDDNRLWVRQQRGDVVLTTSLSWADIASARVDNEAVDVDEVRQRPELATPAPRWQAAVEPAAVEVAAASGVPTTLIKPQRRVRSVEIVSACLANFDRDVEPDGLAVSITALDDAGIPMPVRGNLTARLYGELRPGSVREVAFGTLDQWTQPVGTDDFDSGLATYELRFRRTAPEWQFDLLPDAVVEVSLLAFGEGQFAASAPLIIRAFNPLRDNQQLLLKSRFLPGEHRGPLPSSMPMNRDGLWLNWAW